MFSTLSTTAVVHLQEKPFFANNYFNNVIENVNTAFEELEDLLAVHNICIAVKEKLVKDSGVADESAYDNIVQKLLTKPRARGCIIFGSDQEVAGVMRAVRRSNATGSFSWIGSDGWSARSLVSDGNEAEVEGTLSVQPQANPVRGFEEYFLALNVENNPRNPWFVGKDEAELLISLNVSTPHANHPNNNYSSCRCIQFSLAYYSSLFSVPPLVMSHPSKPERIISVRDTEFWEHHFHCRYPNSSKTPYTEKHAPLCSGKEKLTRQNTVFEDQLQFVSDAVMAFAYAIR
ncbi:hypothetical protein GEV33_011154 [Tenebrio molitor]|uniref:Receptor ligand binding region domain-containing protein n=1 Tax=Tenebrio molitor TaxID=7067 RepID=A0A8J6HBJ0_TENMO|nr:hypothetical protein GEV33_011154 [Tenebrio molitor]